MVRFLNVFLGKLRVVVIIYGNYLSFVIMFNGYCIFFVFEGVIDFVLIIGGRRCLDRVLVSVGIVMFVVRSFFCKIVVFFIFGKIDFFLIDLYIFVKGIF